MVDKDLPVVIFERHVGLRRDDGDIGEIVHLYRAREQFFQRQAAAVGVVQRRGVEPVRLYALQVGYMYMTAPEVTGLRGYLLAGGFLMIDDFWGSAEWANFEAEIKRVLPEYPIIEIPLDHPVFTTFYNIDEIVQVPNIGRAQGGPTWQRDGITPHVRGIFDEQGRLMVMINWNTDIGDAWEWAESPYYPLRYSTYAIEITVNAIVYAMSH